MFNRGFRRDDRNSFRSNPNMSRGHNAPSLMSVSPWEGGIVPGSSGSSILGTPQLQAAQNLLTPQAQVLAQNLNILSNLGLLQPQMQSRQNQSNLPSLINLGSALNRTLGLQNSGYQNRGPMNRFQDRQKFGRPDMRRNDAFNKNRPRNGQSQSSQQKLQSYRPLNSKLTPLSTTRKIGAQGGDALAKARADVRGKRPREDSKSGSDGEGDEDSKKEEGEECVKKRDWKKEKGDGNKDNNDEDTDKSPDTEGAVDVKVEGNGVEESKSDEAEGEEKDENSADKDEEKDKSIESSIYSCHVCTKVVADEEAFSAHLRTAYHKRMMNDLEETYAIKVKRLRDQMRMLEQQKEMEMNLRGRLRRTNLQRGHCKMCDLSFFGNITAHRKTPLHVKLKNFLHPNCVPCGKEFPARMEWDMHKLTVEHLKVTSGRKYHKTYNKLGEPNYSRLVPKFPEGLDSTAVTNIEEEMADKNVEGSEDGAIKYDPTLITGINMLVHGQHCGVCSKFFARRPDALEHCKTRTHFDNYLLMKAKLQAAAEEEEAAMLEAEKQAKAAAEAAAEAEVEAEIEAEIQAEALKDQDEGVAGNAEISLDNSKVLQNIKEEKDDSQIEPDKRVPVVSLKRTALRKDEGNWKRSRGVKNVEDEDEADEEDDDQEVTEYPTTAEDIKDEVVLKAVDNDIEIVEIKESQIQDTPEEDNPSPVSKPTNKARRGRKRK